jgi:DNA-binding CsgD family transcriptional regulator
MDAVFAFFFTGIVLGAVLCPLFLPVPGGKNKPPVMGMGFIAFLTAVEFIFRSFGVQLWLNSAAVRGVMAVNEGIITTMCYGLFYLAWLQRPSAGDNRTGKFCSLVLGAALLGSVLARYYSVPFLGAEPPLKGVAVVFNFTKWCMLILGISAAASVLLMRNAVTAECAVKTDWPLILRLIGLASVFTILNAALNMQILPLYLYNNEAVYHPHYLTAAAAVPVLGFLAGRSTARFLRWFTPVAVILFILMSCLPLFEGHPLFNVIMSTLVTIAHYTIWVVFTTVVVEAYGNGGHSNGGHYYGFWFYGMATAIFFSVVFAFFAPVIDPFVPDGTEYRVLFIVIAAVLFMLLAFRLIFPKQRQEPLRLEPFPSTSTLEDIFRDRGLSQREVEVAHLLVKQGFSNKEIGERLYIAAGTAKLHISKIYQKFGVNNRAEFMALFVNKE